jgi:hypothetical protein
MYCHGKEAEGAVFVIANFWALKSDQLLLINRIRKRLIIACSKISKPNTSNCVHVHVQREMRDSKDQDQPSHSGISSSPILICYKKYCKVYRLCEESDTHLPRNFITLHDPFPSSSIPSHPILSPQNDQSSQPTVHAWELFGRYNTVCKGVQSEFATREGRKEH